MDETLWNNLRTRAIVSRSPLFGWFQVQLENILPINASHFRIQFCQERRKQAVWFWSNHGGSKKIKSSLHSRYYVEACIEWRDPFPRLSAWTFGQQLEWLSGKSTRF